jgi:hypothetical protein
MSDLAVRVFQLVRGRDVTGVSGTGVVADGVLWPDGTMTIRWRGDHPSTVHWACLTDAETVHGHGGATRFVWVAAGPPVVEVTDAMVDRAFVALYGDGLRTNKRTNPLWRQQQTALRAALEAGDG